MAGVRTSKNFLYVIAAEQYGLDLKNLLKGNQPIKGRNLLLHVISKNALFFSSIKWSHSIT